MNRRARKLVLLLSGRTGQVLVSAAVLWTVLLINGWPGPVFYTMLAAIIFLRVAHGLAFDSETIFHSHPSRTRLGRVVKDEIQISLAYVAIVYAMQWPITREIIAVFLTVNLFLQTGMMFFSRLVVRILAAQAQGTSYSRNGKQVIIVGTGLKALAVADSILDAPEADTSVTGFLDYHKVGLWSYRDIPLIGHPDLLGRITSTGQVNAVLIAAEMQDVPRTLDLFKTTEQMGVTICFIPDLYETRWMKAQLTSLNGTPALMYRTITEGRWSLLVKGFIDRVGAAVGLILAAPVMLLTAAAIKIDSRGPILFKHWRAGLNGKRFLLYKFRTMYNGADKKKHELKKLNIMSGPVFKAKNDPRVTRVGRLLRRWSIDEIPQFLNILRGEMSLVGPRPPLPEEVAQYQPWQHRKLSVKPGVTCLWQVNGRNNIDFEEWMRLDLQYINNRSLWLDAKILAKTVPAVIRGDGAS